MTRIRALVLVVAAASLLTACGGAGTGRSGGESNGPGKLTAKFDMTGKEVTRELIPKSGAVNAFSIIPKSGSSVNIIDYQINLANYDLDPQTLSAGYPKKDGDLRIDIQVLGDKDATEKTPIKAGTYPANLPADGENVYGKAWHVIIRYFEDGKIKDSGLNAAYPRGARKGFVKINSISGGVLTGEIDLSDDHASIKGTFSAKVDQK
jgi:hypothetical protein